MVIDPNNEPAVPISETPPDVPCCTFFPDMISIGYNDGGLDFWKYTLQQSIQTGENRTSEKTSTNKFRFEKRMKNLARINKESKLVGIKSYIQKLEMIKEQCKTILRKLLSKYCIAECAYFLTVYGF